MKFGNSLGNSFSNSIASAVLVASATVFLAGAAIAQTPAKKPAAPAAAAKPAAGEINVPAEQRDLSLKERLAQGQPDRQHKGGPAALDQAEDTGFANACPVRNARPRQLARDDAGGADLLEPRFGLGVNVAADRDRGRLDVRDDGTDRRGRVVGRGGADGFGVRRFRRVMMDGAVRTIRRRRSARSAGQP